MIEPNIESIKRLAETFGITIDELLKNEDEKFDISKIDILECLKNNIVPFIILDKNKLFYYRGLKEYKNEKGLLIDTCLNAQDQYMNMIEYYLK